LTVRRPPAVRLEQINEPNGGDSHRSASCVSRRMAASAETVSTMALLMSAQLPIAARTSNRDAVQDPHLLHGPGPETNRRYAVHSLFHLGPCQRGIGDRPGHHSAHPMSRRSQVLPSAFSPWLSDDQPTPGSLRRSTASAACRMACSTNRLAGVNRKRQLLTGTAVVGYRCGRFHCALWACVRVSREARFSMHAGRCLDGRGL
jgi:hypothetical protein